MENVLQDINSKFISLPEEEVKRNNELLDWVLTFFINKMKEVDPLFEAMYSRIFYGGSYYDGLKVGKPEEYDVDLLLILPKYAQPKLTTSNLPGYVHLQLKNYQGWIGQPEAMPAYRNFANLFDDNWYLDTQKVLSWMEGIVQKALNQLGSNSSGRATTTIGLYKEGPALTLQIYSSGVKMNVDLVTCFVFSEDKWPEPGFRTNPVKSKPEFFIVPKKPKQDHVVQAPRYWRLSFQEQERVLIDDKRTLKPTVKLLKKLRDTLEHKKVASYYIKTVVLHIVETKSDEFWRNPLSHTFMAVLKEYKDYIERGRIPYYWNKNNNLIGRVDERTLQNIANRLKVVINDIERNPQQPNVVAKYLLNNDEQNRFMMGRLRV